MATNLTKYFRFATIGTAAILDLLGKATDGILTLAECFDFVRNTIARILPDATKKDLERFAILSSCVEFGEADFMEGDIALILPNQFVKKLKIELNPE